MSRLRIDVQQYGYQGSTEAFTDTVADIFNAMVRGQRSFDEMLLHPREALEFCDTVRGILKLTEIPDDTILRAIMQRRKNP